MRRLQRSLSLLPLCLAMAACSGAGDNIFAAAFPVSRMGTEARLSGLDTSGATMSRVLGRPDGLQPLTEDESLSRVSDGRSTRDLLDMEGTRRSQIDQLEEPQSPARPAPRRSSSTPPQASALPEANAPPVVPPPPSPSAASPRALPPGTAIPNAQGATVAGAGTASTATTIGPAGQSGTATRDGGTVTLFGADGSIRTVPVPAATR